jgi:zinc/manganese transport system permease protein
MLELMAAPFAACVILVGIHAYLGLHVIQRKIIFVDLALAQIAALGATFGFLVGIGPHEPGAYMFSLGFAIVGAAVFALTRMRHERIPQEAIIGIVYAVALATAILVADRAPEGAEHIKETMVGTLLWVRWPTIAKTAIIYALVGLLHFFLRERFLQISFAPGKAYAEQRWIRLWDFIFYVTFAFVITSSVAIAGVLVVFSFLVIPAVIATLFATSISGRLAVGWCVGIVACLLGMVASYRFDLPSGPSVVVSLGLALVLAGLLYSIRTAAKRRYALFKVLAGIVILTGVMGALGIFFTSGTFMHIAHEHDWEQTEAEPAAAEHLVHLREDLVSACGDDLDCLIVHLRELPDWSSHVEFHARSSHGLEHEWWLDLIGRIGDPRALDILAGLGADEEDPMSRVDLARRLESAGDVRGATLAMTVLVDGVPPLVRDEAIGLIETCAGREFGYDPFGGDDKNAAALERIQAWSRSR